MGSNPVESPEFFGFIRQLLKLSSKCEDHIFIWLDYCNILLYGTPAECASLAGMCCIQVWSYHTIPDQPALASGYPQNRVQGSNASSQMYLWRHTTISFRLDNLICEQFEAFLVGDILVPRGRAPFCQHQESRPLASSDFQSTTLGLPVVLRTLGI